jgi:septum formation protein
MPRLILASASPQRKTLLADLSLTFDVLPSSINEQEWGERDPLSRAQTLATLKARDVSARHPTAITIGCDTLVTSSDGQLLEKPRDDEDARRMLALQSGRVSVVHSGMTVIAPAGEFGGVSSSRVAFKTLSQEEQDWWIGTRLWEDRSGAFQIDGPGQLMIERLEGDWSGVVGLPVFLLGQLLEKAGYDFGELMR